MANQESSAVAAPGPPGLQTFIEGYRPQIAAALNGVLNDKKFIQVAVNTIMGDKNLEASTPHSIMSSLLKAAEVQLFPGSAHGFAYLVPYYSKKESAYVCQYILGYRGILALCHRSEKILKVEAHTVHKGDGFEISYGLDGGLKHTPEPWGARDMKTLVGAYAIAYMANGTTHFETLSAEELSKIRQRAKSKTAGPWDTDPLPMCRKSTVLKLARWLPLEAKDQAAINQEERDDIVQEPGARYVSDENSNLRERLSPASNGAPETANAGEIVREMDELLTRDNETETDSEEGWIADGE